MWDTQIGEGNYGNSATTIKDYDFISHNSVSYWYTNSTLNHLGFKLGKQTPEGQHLESLILKNAPKEEVLEYLDSLMFRFCPADKIIAAIKTIKKDYFEMGKRSKLNEFKKFLEIDY